ncbi:50S ribosomal protein L4 [Striga asiatica]|uniref:50S ribosomal protein L4 n=1 Tax=Striga asiatica TaxID=4170 RepID=A0A5A7R3P1_STRAF|nr:50S ribosomal protein L4 [Striga asiatica]
MSEAVGLNSIRGIKDYDIDKETCAIWLSRKHVVIFPIRITRTVVANERNIFNVAKKISITNPVASTCFVSSSIFTFKNSVYPGFHETPILTGPAGGTAHPFGFIAESPGHMILLSSLTGFGSKSLTIPFSGVQNPNLRSPLPTTLNISNVEGFSGPIAELAFDRTIFSTAIADAVTVSTFRACTKEKCGPMRPRLLSSTSDERLEYRRSSSWSQTAPATIHACSSRIMPTSSAAANDRDPSAGPTWTRKTLTIWFLLSAASSSLSMWAPPADGGAATVSESAILASRNAALRRERNRRPTAESL